MIEPHNVGAGEVLAAIKDLERELNNFTRTTAVDVALLKRDVTVLQAEREADRTRRWQLHLALVSALVAVALGVAGIIFK